MGRVRDIREARRDQPAGTRLNGGNQGLADLEDRNESLFN